MEQTKEEIKARRKRRRVTALVLALLLVAFPAGELCHAAGLLPQSPGVAVLELFGASATDSTNTIAAFCYVGQGDCTVLKSGNAAAVIDFGEADESGALSKELRRLGIDRVDIALVSHLHTDHIGGLARIMEDFPVKTLVMRDTPAEDGAREVAEAVLAKAEAAGTEWIAPVAGQCFRFGSATLDILFTDAAAEEENNRSVVCKATLAGRSILFPGDIERKPMDKLLKSGIDISCDILKLPHHGSATSADTDFYRATAPRIAVASSGYDNLHRHPSATTLELLRKLNIPVYRTDLNRTVICRFPDGKLTVTTERG